VIATEQLDSIESLPSWRLGTALFVLSFATVLFTIALFRLLTFFIMPSLFFDLLFIGFPLGAMLGAYLFKITKASFVKTLWGLQGTMLFSGLAMLACKNFDYLRAHLFDVELQRLFAQMLIFTGFFLPFFIAYGLSEYIGYQVGRRRLQGRMPVVYALYLFGAAGAYLVAQYLFALLGAARVLLLPFLLVGSACLTLRPHLPARRLLLAQQVVLVILLLLPQIEGGFLGLYKGSSLQSTHAYAEMGFEPVYQHWGRYSLIDVMKAPVGETYAGFYNDIIQWWFTPGNGYFQHSLGMLPMELVPEGGRIAIVGAGAGRQIQYARSLDRHFAELLAIEIEPATVGAVRGALAERFDRVYSRDDVVVAVTEARGFMERTKQVFDLIYMPSVGGYPQMMLEPGNMIRTLEAYRTLARRLTERGILAIGYANVLDPKGILTEQYMHTLESPEIGLTVRAYRNQGEVLILAARSPDHLPSLEAVQAFSLRPVRAMFGPDFIPPFFDLPVAVKETWEKADFVPIRDDQPFLAGNVRHIFSLHQVGELALLVGGLMLSFALVLLLLLRRRGNPGIPGRSYAQTIGVSLLVGANFLILEHYLILTLFHKLYVYYDALVLGAVSFLIITGLGSSLIAARSRAAFQLVGAVFILLLLLLQDTISPWIGVALLAPVAFVTGSFFPAMFEAAADNPLGVFAADSIGAALGSMISFFIPIVFGFEWFFVVATLAFWLTAIAVYRFFRQGRRADVCIETTDVAV
jgi:spermidine synthase